MNLDDLYQEVILDHKRHPRNFRDMPDATYHVDGHNPLCGDHINLHIKLDGDRIEDVSFQGNGCAISVASASLMTERVKGLSKDQASLLFEDVHRLLTESDSQADFTSMGKLAVFAGVRRFPSRVKCASLSWHTLKAALAGEGQGAITTE